MRSPQALVDSKTLEWARQTAGLNVESAAKKLGVSPERLRQWEEKKKSPTVKQLRKMARVYHRPIGLFFLPALPQEADSIRDFRRMAGIAVPSFSSALRFELRLALERREEALELASELKQG